VPAHSGSTATFPWSLGILLTELAELYRGRLTGVAAPLEPPGRYRDFACWQQTSDEPKRAIDYWLRELDGSRPSDLPARTDPDPDIARSLLRRSIPDDLVERGRDYAIGCRVSVFMVLAAAFAAALAAHTGRRDVLFGTNAANRQQGERTVGLFVTTLPVRVRIPPRCTFHELVGLVREVLLTGLAHEAVPFGQLVAERKRRGELPAGPVPLPVMLVNVPPLPPADRVGDSRWVWRGTGVDFGTAAAGVSLLVGERDGEVTVTAEYHRERYHPDDVARLITTWLHTLHLGLTAPSRPVSTMAGATPSSL
jgi:hypothetical protein